jgi:hypothetical protein
MTDPVILAAAAVLLIPSLAPSIHVPPNFSVAQAQAAYAALCQTDPRIAREAQATTVRRARDGRLTVRWRGWPHHRHHYHRRHR